MLGADGFTPQHDVEEIRQIETQLKRRFPIGAQVYTFVKMLFIKMQINLQCGGTIPCLKVLLFLIGLGKENNSGFFKTGMYHM